MKKRRVPAQLCYQNPQKYKVDNTYRASFYIAIVKTFFLRLNSFRMGFLGVLLLVLTLPSYAALSAKTSQTIMGTAPYFLLEDSAGTKTKLLTIDQLLHFQYKDATGTVKYADSSMASSPIIVNSSMKINELVASVGIDIDNTSHPLAAIVTAPSSKLTIGDIDGDATQPSATGSLTATLKLNGTVITPTAVTFDGCAGVYTLEIKATADSGISNLQAKTQYGDPSSSDYSPNNVTYTIQPDVSVPYVCYVQPNLTNGITFYAGPSTQWNPSKGFIPNSTAVHSTTNTTGVNFPTIGFNYAYFNLMLVGTTAQQIIDSTETLSGSGEVHMAGSDVYLQLEANPTQTDIVKVTLRGPSDSSPPTKAHTSTTFNLLSGTDSVYSFNVDKWFVVKPGTFQYSVSGNNQTPNYCANLSTGGNHYRVPYVADYTNAIPSAPIGLGGGDGGNYTRRLGGGLFAEWGYTVSTYYINGIFDGTFYWASEARASNSQYIINSMTGKIRSNSLVSTLPGVTCISPL